MEREADIAEFDPLAENMSDNAENLDVNLQVDKSSEIVQLKAQSQLESADSESLNIVVAKDKQTDVKPVQFRAVAESRGIIVIGNRGAGKRTLLKYWLLHDADTGESLKDKESITVVHESNNNALVYNIQIIEDLALMQSFARDERERSRVLAQYQTKLPRNISLIVFVFKHGRFTNEDKNMFESVIQSMKVKPIGYLVITNCETLDTNAKDWVIQEFKTNPQTKRIASFMSDIVCVGFPDIKVVKPNFKMAYEEICKECTKEVNAKLIPKHNLPIGDVIYKPELEMVTSSECCQLM